MYRHTIFFAAFILYIFFNLLFFSVSSAEENYIDAVHINEFLPDPDADFRGDLGAGCRTGHCRRSGKCDVQPADHF